VANLININYQFLLLPMYLICKIVIYFLNITLINVIIECSVTLFVCSPSLEIMNL